MSGLYFDMFRVAVKIVNAANGGFPPAFVSLIAGFPTPLIGISPSGA